MAWNRKVVLAGLAVFALIAVGTLTSFTSDGVSADAATGVWYTSDKSAKVEIYQEGGKYHGKLIWGEDLTDESRDDENPDASLRSRKLKGLTILKDFVYEGDGEWEDGTIYDPESGKTYSCIMTLTSEGRLKVRGYIGFSLIGRTEVWTRAE